MSAVLLEVDELTVRYGGARDVLAVDAASLRIAPGEMLALVGESGSGKSTLARAVAGIVPPSGGRIRLDGTDLATLRGAAARPVRRRIQMVFQDPDASLNPYHEAGDALREPLALMGLRGAAADARLRQLAEMVQLDPVLLERRPRHLSGGQKQRVAIARALAIEPSLLIADEALSALDISTQATIADLLRDLRRRLDLAILFISHDLLMVRYLADRIAVMRHGRIVETGPCAAVLAAPAHAYTRLLIASTPDLGQRGLDLDAAEIEEVEA